MAGKTALNLNVLILFQTALVILFIFLDATSADPVDFQLQVKFQFPFPWQSQSQSRSSVLRETVNKIRGVFEGKGKRNELEDVANVHFILRNQETETAQGLSDFVQSEILSFHTNPKSKSSKYYSVSINNPRLFLYKNSQGVLNLNSNSNSKSRSISKYEKAALCQNFESEPASEQCFWDRSKYFLKHTSPFELVIFQLDEILDFLQKADAPLISKLNQRVSNKNLHIFIGGRKKVEAILETRGSSPYFRFLDKIRVKIGVDWDSGDIYSGKTGTGIRKALPWFSIREDASEKQLEALVLSWRFNNPRFFSGKFIRFGIFAARHHYMPVESGSNRKSKFPREKGKNSPTKFIGCSYNFIVGAAAFYNFTYVLKPQPLENEFDPVLGKYTGYLQPLIDEDFDIFGYHAVPPLSEVNTSTTTFAYISSIKFLTSKPPFEDSLSKWKVVLAPFSTSVWTLLILTSGVVGAIFGFYHLPLEASFAVLMSQSINLKTVAVERSTGKRRGPHDNDNDDDDHVHIFGRRSAVPVISLIRSASLVPSSLAVLWILASIIIVNYYNSDLLSILTIPKKEKYPETFAELLDLSTVKKDDERHFNVNLMTMPGRPDSFLLKNSTYPFFATREERDERFIDGHECVAKVLTEKRVACIGFYTILTPIFANLLTIHRNIEPCVFSTNDAFSAAVSASVKKNSKYEGGILEMLGFIRDTGHIERWKDDVSYHAQGLSIQAHTKSSKRKQHEQQEKEEEEEDGPYENVEKLPSWPSVHKYLYSLLHENTFTAKSISSSLYSIFLGLLALALIGGGAIFMCENFYRKSGNRKLRQEGMSISISISRGIYKLIGIFRGRGLKIRVMKEGDWAAHNL